MVEILGSYHWYFLCLPVYIVYNFSFCITSCMFSEVLKESYLHVHKHTTNAIKS